MVFGPVCHSSTTAGAVNSACPSVVRHPVSSFPGALVTGSSLLSLHSAPSLSLLRFAQLQPFRSNLDVFRGVWHLTEGPHAFFPVVISPTRPHHAILRHGMVFPTAVCDVGCSRWPGRLEASFSCPKRRGEWTLAKSWRPMPESTRWFIRQPLFL